MQEETIIIDCPHCEERVQAAAARPWVDHDYEYRIGVVTCPKCYNPLVAYQDFLGPQGPHGIEEYGEAQRLWPSPEAVLSMRIPELIRASLAEARKCVSCGTHTASVAMTGRALEALCHHFKTKKTTLFDGLKELWARDIIDQRLYTWADELRQHRNLAAHASGAQFIRQDAEDIFNFALAICDYLFVLNTKFEEFKKRVSTRPARKRTRRTPLI
jgi:hypothetical protein